MPKTLPPIRQPGTHTNAEVKAALHARGFRRTIIVTAIVFLLLACLAVVSSTAQQYEREDTSPRKPKLAMLVTSKLSSRDIKDAITNGKAPFISLLSAAGGLNRPLSSGSGSREAGLVRLLTGAPDSSATTLEGSTSFLRELNTAGFKPVVVAPSNFWSGSVSDGDKCAKIGLFDTECSGDRCPAADAAAYCNAYQKFSSCDSKVQLYQQEIIKGFREAIKRDADAYYVQLNSIGGQAAENTNANETIQELSEINLLDGSLGQIALALSQRTHAMAENWLIVVTSDGMNAAREAPLVMAAYSDGGLIQLKVEDNSRSIADLRGTVLKWFGKTPAGVDQSRNIGICSDGIHVLNCREN